MSRVASNIRKTAGYMEERAASGVRSAGRYLEKGGRYVADETGRALSYGEDELAKGGRYVVDKAGKALAYGEEELAKGERFVKEEAGKALAYGEKELEKGGRYVEEEAGKALAYGKRELVKGEQFVKDEGRKVWNWIKDEGKSVAQQTPPSAKQRWDDSGVDRNPATGSSQSVAPRSYRPPTNRVAESYDDQNDGRGNMQPTTRSSNRSRDPDNDRGSERRNTQWTSRQPEMSRDRDDVPSANEPGAVCKTACSMTRSEYVKYCRIARDEHGIENLVDAAQQLECVEDIPCDPGCCVRVGEFILSLDLGVIQISNKCANPLTINGFAISQLKALITRSRAMPSISCEVTDCCEWCDEIAPGVYPLSCNNGNVAPCSITIPPKATATLIVLKGKSPSFYVSGSDLALIQSASMFQAAYES